MKVVWTERAQQRLREIHDYIAQDQPLNAVRFIERILIRGEQIGDHPLAGRIVPEYRRDYIREIFEGTYRIIYRIRTERIDVLSVCSSTLKLPSLPRV